MNRLADLLCSAARNLFKRQPTPLQQVLQRVADYEGLKFVGGRAQRDAIFTRDHQSTHTDRMSVGDIGNLLEQFVADKKLLEHRIAGGLIAVVVPSALKIGSDTSLFTEWVSSSDVDGRQPLGAALYGRGMQSRVRRYEVSAAAVLLELTQTISQLDEAQTATARPETCHEMAYGEGLAIA